MHSLKERLNEILIKNGLITEEDLKKALQIQKKEGGSLGRILVREGFIGEKELMAATSEGLRIPPILLSKFKIDPELLKLIPAYIARHYQIVPVSKVGETLTVAMADPLNVFAIDDIRTLTGFAIGPIITTQKEIREVLDQYYGEATHEVIEELAEGIKTGEIEIVKAEPGLEEIDSARLIKLVEEAPVVKVTNLLLSNAIKTRASDILIEPLENTLRVRYRVDGVLREVEAPPKSMHESIVSRIKVISQLDIAERRLPQDGRFKMRFEDREVDFRVSVLPSVRGEKVALRILDKTSAMLDIEKLGFETDSLERLKKSAKRPHGMILACGPTGCGKTTTLYSLLKFVDSPEKNIISVEDPVEYQLRGINQVTVHPVIGLTFASSLRSILRQDPDIIMIGEIRDFDTVDIAIKAALTGHLVLSTLHTTTVAGSIVRLCNMGVENFLLSASLIAVMAQRLVRLLCPKCKEPYKPSEVILKRLVPVAAPGMERDLTFYRTKGCTSCLNSGYTGRIGICEVLILTPAIRELIFKGSEEHEIKKIARSEGMRTLREDGLEKVIRGTTSLEEVLRVTVADE